MEEQNLEDNEKDKRVIKQILALEKTNNRSQHYTNQDMVQKIIEIIKKGVNDEI